MAANNLSRLESYSRRIRFCDGIVNWYRKVRAFAIITIGRIASLRLRPSLDFGHRESCFPTAKRAADG